MIRGPLIAFGAVVMLAVAVLAYEAVEFTASGASPSQQEVVYEVQPRVPFRVIAQKLEELGVVSSAWKLRVLARVTGLGSQMRRGEYALQPSMRPGQILSILASGKSLTHPLTIPEGWNIFEIAAEYESKGFGPKTDFLAAARDPQLIQALLGVPAVSFEGYLFPETYNLTKYTTAKELVTQMVRNFIKVYGETKAAAAPTNWSREQIVTLASMVEKETGAPEERPLIASVFYNRLRKHMRLQSDPTILYGMWVRSGVMPTNITRADITGPTAYNTYTVPALPVAPIANPGRAALASVFKPATSEYLFFVSRNEGTHLFSKTYADHTAAVRKFQLDPKAREGHSWRELSK